MADLNLYCIYQNFRGGWMTFIYEYDKQCTNYLQECADSVMDKLNIDKTIIHQCIDNSFEKKKEHMKDIFKDDNTLFRKQKLYNQKQAVFNIPAVYINDQMFKGSLHGKDIFNAICEHSRGNIKECHQEQRVIEGRIKWKPLIIVILLILLISVILFYFYRRKILREMKLQVNDEVSILVNKFIENKKRQL